MNFTSLTLAVNQAESAALRCVPSATWRLDRAMDQFIKFNKFNILFDNL